MDQWVKDGKIDKDNRSVQNIHGKQTLPFNIYADS